MKHTLLASIRHEASVFFMVSTRQRSQSAAKGVSKVSALRNIEANNPEAAELRNTRACIVDKTRIISLKNTP